MEMVGKIVLVISGIYFSFKLKFKHFNMIKAVKTMLKSNNLGISSFQSLCISLASKIGVGSLAGVVLSIYVGGVGSIFWMWIITLICSIVFDSSDFNVRDCDSNTVICEIIHLSIEIDVTFVDITFFI